VALDLTGRDYISYSAISTYQKCPLRYFFVYLAGLAPEFVSSSLVFGGAIHSGIEHHYRQVFEGGTPPSLDDLVAAYEQSWQTEAACPVRFGKDESRDSLRAVARRVLAAFQASPAAEPNGTVLAIEEEFRAPVILGCPDLLGRIDLLVLDDGRLRVIDFKTSRSRWNAAKVEEATPQMLLYAELARPLAQELGVEEVRLEWIVITKAKQPAVEKHGLTPTPGQIAWVKAVVRNVWDSIKSGCFYPSSSSASCATCPFGRACKTWEG